MAYIWFLILVGIFWQPLYLTGIMIYHLFKKDATDSTDYWNFLSNWLKKFLSLVFSSPTA